MKFNNSALRAIKTPDKLTDFRDKRYPNLMLRVTPHNCRTFYFVYQDDQNKRTKVKVGRYTGEGSLKSIMTKYSSLYTGYHLGQDPGREERERREALKAIPIVEDVAEEYIEFIKARNSHNTYRNVKSQITKHVIGYFGSKRVTDIKRPDIVKFLDHLQNTGLSSGTNQILARLRAFFSWMVDRGYVEHNPAKGIKKPVATNGSRVALTDKELTKFLKALNGSTSIPSQSKNAVRLILLTGTRREEACSAPWDEIDRDEKLWRLGKTRKLKTEGSKRDVPITDHMMAIFDDQKNDTNKVFVKLKGQTLGQHFKVFVEAELPGMKLDLHTLRHTFIDLTKRLRIPREVSMAITGHDFTDLHAGYEHYTYLDEAREAMEKIHKHLKELSE